MRQLRRDDWDETIDTGRFWDWIWPQFITWIWPHLSNGNAKLVVGRPDTRLGAIYWPDSSNHKFALTFNLTTPLKTHSRILISRKVNQKEKTTWIDQFGKIEKTQNFPPTHRRRTWFRNPYPISLDVWDMGSNLSRQSERKEEKREDLAVYDAQNYRKICEKYMLVISFDHKWL